MNRDIRNFEHLVCEEGHELTWRGRWQHVVPRQQFCWAEPDIATFPRRYFKDAEIRRAVGR